MTTNARKLADALKCVERKKNQPNITKYTEFAVVHSGSIHLSYASSPITGRQRINCPKHSSMIQE